MYTAAVRLLKYPAVTGKLWAVQYLGQNWDKIMTSWRADPASSNDISSPGAAAWTPGHAAQFLLACMRKAVIFSCFNYHLGENAFSVKEPTLTLLLLDLFNLLIPPPVVPPGQYCEDVTKMMVKLLGDQVLFSC